MRDPAGDPDIITRLGHAVPVETIQKFSDDRESARELVHLVNTHEIRSPEMFDQANELMLQVKEKYRTISKALRSITDPLETSKKNAHLLFDPVLSALARAEIDVKAAMGNWKLAEKAHKDEEDRLSKLRLAAVQKEIDEQRKRDADAAAELAKKEALAAAKKAGLRKVEAETVAKGKAEEVRATVLAMPKPILAPKPVAPVEQSFVSESGRSNVQFEYDYEVLDVMELLVAEPLLVDVVPRRAAILALLRKTSGAPVAGLKVKTTAKVTGIL